MSARSGACPAGLARLLLALSASEFGDKLVQVAYALIAVRTGSTMFLAAVLAAQTVPVLALTPLVSARGWIRSRTAWRAGLIGQVAAFAVAATMAGDRTAVLAGVLVASSCEALTMPFSRSLLHALSDGRQAELARWWAVSKAGAGAAGMVLAGLVVGLSGPGPAFALNALTFLLVLAVAWSPRVPEDGARSHRSATAGFRGLLSPGAFGALGLLCVTTMLLTTSLEGVSGPFMLARTPGYDANGLGVVMACWAVASMITAAATPKRFTGVRLLLPLTNVLVALALGLPSLGLPFWTAAATFALGGISNGVFNLLLTRVIWSGIPAESQPHAWAAFNWLLNASLFLSFATGFFVHARHAPALLAGVSAVCLAAGCLYLSLLARAPKSARAIA
ncbi:MFS transporter [Streptomyces misionensis]|uniref:MFS transporter n=1 Tax=Streptomyces misionensis TaxID=67331 RepID=A0A5C6JB15_9ACTN|nr:MFS transporter [Streptomyces misionensis]TWV37735.1 MFS transporter [Streptomyces misionensis]